jgi:galactose-1-phosphate uridylyltransferase (family 1)
MSQLYQVESVRGTSRVICFSPKHNLTMSKMTIVEILPIIKTWKAQIIDLSKNEFVNYVTIFENKGEAMGCSNPHPHGQIWATENIPQEPAGEIESLKSYKTKNDSCMICDLVNLEVINNQRIVIQNDSFVCFVPFWAVWPFETIIVSKSHTSSLIQFTTKLEEDLGNFYFYCSGGFAGNHYKIRQPFPMFISIFYGHSSKSMQRKPKGSYYAFSYPFLSTIVTVFDSKEVFSWVTYI